MDVERLLHKAQMEDLKNHLAQAKKLINEDTNKETRAEISQIDKCLQEQLSSGDWTKFGAIAGILWYRIDKIIDELRQLNQTASRMRR